MGPAVLGDLLSVSWLSERPELGPCDDLILQLYVMSPGAKKVSDPVCGPCYLLQVVMVWYIS